MEWYVENANWLLPTISACVAIITFVLTFVLSKTKSAKVAKACKTALDILGYANKAVELAEVFKHFNGEEKKAYATTLIKDWCISANVDYTDEQINDAIENIISVSKKVNQRDKDKVVKVN